MKKEVKKPGKSQVESPKSGSYKVPATKKEGRGHSKNITYDIIKLKTVNPHLSHEEISRITNCHPSNVTRTLQRHNIKSEQVNTYRKVRADLLAGIQEKLLHSIDEDKLTKANIQQIATSYGILYDKERLERNLSTQNVALSGMVQLLDKDKITNNKDEKIA